MAIIYLNDFIHTLACDSFGTNRLVTQVYAQFESIFIFYFKQALSYINIIFTEIEGFSFIGTDAMWAYINCFCEAVTLIMQFL